MMRTRFLVGLNSLTLLVTLSLLWSAWQPRLSQRRQPVPVAGPAQPARPATHLAYVTFDGQTGIVARPLAAGGPLQPDSASFTLFSQPAPAACQADNLFAAPQGQNLILEYNCPGGGYIQALAGVGSEGVQETRLAGGHFLDWSPDGQWFLFRQVDEEAVWLVAAAGAEQYSLALPAETYGATFTPDGRSVVYTASAGLGAGSELGRLDLASGRRQLWRSFPQQIIAYPRWSPDGRQLAYILMPDSNVPFTLGELWLAGPTGAPLRRLDEANAGHGDRPVWTPNSQAIVYVRRENRDSRPADYQADALQSNLYRVEVNSGAVTQLTHFAASRVAQPQWAPGSRLAFTADDTIWLWQPEQALVQVSQPGAAAHPVWLALPAP